MQTNSTIMETSHSEATFSHTTSTGGSTINVASGFTNCPGAERCIRPETRRLDACGTRTQNGRVLGCVVLLWAIAGLGQDLTKTPTNLTLEASPTILEAPTSAATNWNVGLTFAGGFGVAAMGSRVAHDVATTTLHAGKLPQTEHPFFSHIEWGGELWGGGQFNPESAYLVGFTPILRYHFLPKGRFAPFVDGGAGVGATDIMHPDLSTTFEFNLQAGAGFHWCLRKDLALTFQARYLHISNAGLDTPNNGVNTFLFGAGLTRFF